MSIYNFSAIFNGFRKNRSLECMQISVVQHSRINLKQRLIFSNLFQHIDGGCPSPKISEYLRANTHLTRFYAKVNCICFEKDAEPLSFFRKSLPQQTGTQGLNLQIYSWATVISKCYPLCSKGPIQYHVWDCSWGCKKISNCRSLIYRSVCLRKWQNVWLIP